MLRFLPPDLSTHAGGVFQAFTRDSRDDELTASLAIAPRPSAPPTTPHCAAYAVELRNLLTLDLDAFLRDAVQPLTGLPASEFEGTRQAFASALSRISTSKKPDGERGAELVRSAIAMHVPPQKTTLPSLTEVTPLSPVALANPVYGAQLRTLVSMGFATQPAWRALCETKGDLQRSIEILIREPTQGTTANR